MGYSDGSMVCDLRQMVSGIGLIPWPPSLQVPRRQTLLCARVPEVTGRHLMGEHPCRCVWVGFVCLRVRVHCWRLGKALIS